LRVYLPHGEGLVLYTLPQRIEELLSREDFNRRVAERLFPVAYEDADKEAEYRKLLGDDLRKSKLESLRAKVRRSVDQHDPLLSTTIGEAQAYAGTPAPVSRIRGGAYVTLATDDRNARGGSGTEKGEAEAGKNRSWWHAPSGLSARRGERFASRSLPRPRPLPTAPNPAAHPHSSPAAFHSPSRRSISPSRSSPW